MPGTTPIVGDFLQVRVDCQANDQLSQNVLHYAVTATGGGGLSLQFIANVFGATLAAAYRNWLPGAASFSQITVQNLSPPQTNPATSAAVGGAGLVLGNLQPRQASGLLRFHTDLGGRANRGRAYIGFIAGSSVDVNGELNGAGTALLVAVGNAIGPFPNIILGGASTSLRLQIRHPNLPGPPPTPTGTPVNSIQATALIATQRRRGDFGASNP